MGHQLLSVSVQRLGARLAAIVLPDGDPLGRERRLRLRPVMTARPRCAEGQRRGDGSEPESAVSRALAAGRCCRSF